MADYTAGPASNASTPVAPYRRADDFGFDEALAPLRAKLEERRQQAQMTERVKSAAETSIGVAKWYQQRKSGVTGDGSGFSTGVENDWDAMAQNYIDQAPEGVKDFLAQRMAQLKASYVGDALDYETKLTTASHYRSGQQAIDVMNNGVRSDPKLFAPSVGNLSALVAGLDLPPDMKAKLLDDGREQLGINYAQGLADQDPYAAKRMLDRGELDTFLSPQQKDRLESGIHADIRQREAQARMEARVAAGEARTQKLIAGVAITQQLQSNVQSIQDTGKGDPNLSPSVIANTLGPKEAAEWEAKINRAQEIYGVTGDVDMAPSAELMTRLSALPQPTPGSADYANEKDAYDIANKKISQALDKRRIDPAAAVATAVGDTSGLDDYQIAQKRLQAQSALGIPELAQQPLTKDEVDVFRRQVMMSDPESDSASGHPNAMEALSDQLKTQYKDLAPLAMRQVLRAVGDRQLSRNDISTGEGLLAAMKTPPADEVTRRLMRSLGILRQVGGSQKAVDPGGIAPATSDGTERSPDAAPHFELSDPVVQPAMKVPGQLYLPPPAAIAILLSNPATAQDFDSHFGPGAANYYIARERTSRGMP